MMPATRRSVAVGRTGCPPGRSARVPLDPLPAPLILAFSLCAAGQSITEQGISAFQHGRYVEACRLLEDAVSRDRGDEHARAFLALARAASGHCAEAIGDLTARFKIGRA